MRTRVQTKFQLQSEPSERDKRALKRNKVREKLVAPIQVNKENAPNLKKENFLKDYQDPKLFTVGSLVFAKQRGSRPWPAKIVAIEAFPRYKVFYFGSNNYGIVSIGGLYKFCEETNAELGKLPNNQRSKYMKDYVLGLQEILCLSSGQNL